MLAESRFAMTLADLAELNGLYARWGRRKELKLKAWDIWLLVYRMGELGLKLP